MHQRFQIVCWYSKYMYTSQTIVNQDDMMSLNCLTHLLYHMISLLFSTIIKFKRSLLQLYRTYKLWLIWHVEAPWSQRAGSYLLFSNCLSIWVLHEGNSFLQILWKLAKVGIFILTNLSIFLSNFWTVYLSDCLCHHDCWIYSNGISTVQKPITQLKTGICLITIDLTEPKLQLDHRYQL